MQTTLEKYIQTLADTLSTSSTQARFIMAGILMALLLILIATIRRFAIRRLNRWAQAHSNRIDPDLLNSALGSLQWFTSVAGGGFCVLLLPLGDTLLKYLQLGLLVVLTLMGVNLFFHMFSLFFDSYLKTRGGDLGGNRAKVLLPIIKGMAWIVAAAFIMENMGLKIGTIMAGLGVAGIAVGFAAQAVLGDLFSYFAILFDRPFRIGDFVIVGEIRGNIEHIGLKTSRIRSLDGEQIIMSNTDLTNSRVKNYRRMERRRVLFRFGVEYQTPHHKLAAIPGMVREIVADIPRATLDRAHFLQFGDSTLDFEVVYYVESPEYNDYMDIQESINLGLVRRFNEEGIVFAFPTRTVFLQRVDADEPGQNGLMGPAPSA